MPENNPLKEFARICSEIGWNKKLSDLSEDEVIGIISNIQVAQSIDGFYEGENLARIHFQYSDKSWIGDALAPF
jgi:hypothetical protein